MKVGRIPYTLPSITDLEIQYSTDAARNGWGPNCYDYINRFERLFKEHLGTTFAIATASCTGAMHMGLAALGVGPGDEVIIADSNWIAVAAPVVHLGARPVFVDILPDTWCIDPEKAEAAISPRTKAIIAVHLYGNLCDMERLLGIGERHGIAIIEDAAEAIGSVYHGKRAGSIGKFGVFSFHGTKTVTTGEGGMFVTNDSELYNKVLTLSNHGRAREEIRQFWPEMVGFKYKLSNLQAALGCAQLERIETLIERKRQILTNYRQLLNQFLDVSLNAELPGTIIGGWMPTAVFSKESGITREKLQAKFSEANIDARVFFYPLSSLPMFSEYGYSNFNSVNIPNRAINLPSFHDITDFEQARVADVISAMLSRNSKGL